MTLKNRGQVVKENLGADIPKKQGGGLAAGTYL